MKNILRISSAVLVFLLTHSCKKDIEVKTIDKYIIEMNSAFRISKVTHFDSNDNLLDGRIYYYLTKTVIINDVIKSNLISRYYLNNNGLADSCDEPSTRLKYQYDSDKYLISYSYSPYTFINSLSYNNGNRTHVQNYPGLGLDYEYTSLINLVDIDSFKGNYNGNLNTNLISKVKSQVGPHAYQYYTTEYKYNLNDAGLVVQRTLTRIGGDNPGTSGNPIEKLITNFEYTIQK